MNTNSPNKIIFIYEYNNFHHQPTICTQSPVIITLSLIGGDARNKLLLEYLKIVTEMRQFAIYVQ